MTVQKALSKIRLRNGYDVFLMVDYELQGKLVVKIVNIESKEIFVGHLNDIDLRSQAARIRLTFDEFIQKAIKALIECNTSTYNFLYCLDEQGDGYKFQWKSIDEEQTVISLGCVDVTRENFSISLTNIFETIAAEMHLMRTKIRELNTEVNNTQNQTSDALNQLSVATEMKRNLEKEMYSKFVLVLNEKKRKIRDLQQKNKHSHSTNSGFEKKFKNSSKVLISDTSDDADEFENIDDPGPSTAKQNKSLLFLDDNKTILPTNKNKIRNRKRVAIKENGNKATTFINSNQSNQNNDESDDFLLSNL